MALLWFESINWSAVAVQVPVEFRTDFLFVNHNQGKYTCTSEMIYLRLGRTSAAMFVDTRGDLT